MKKTLKDITSNIDMVLFNRAWELEKELESGEEYQKYSDIYTKEQFEESKENGDIESDEEFNNIDYENPKELYQYFAINRTDGEYLSEKCGFPLFYIDELDIFVLWIDFLDNWENQSYNI